MGHLSTSERVDASKVYDSDNNLDKNNSSHTNGNVVLEKSAETNGNCNGACGDNESLINEKNNKNLIKNGSAIRYVDKTDLNVYTNEFKGDRVLGIQFKAPLKWDKVIQITLLHMVFVYGFISFEIEKLSFWTNLFAIVTGGLAGFGVTGGAHRLWTHRAFKAKLPLRIILMGCFSLAGQNTMYDWVRDHRVHHKFSETDADPHNSNRGFFFAHVGWLMMHKHPEVLRRGRQMDMSDILNDPVVQFHQKYFIPLKTLLCFVIPTLIPVYCWDEEWYYAVLTQCIFRYVFSLNFTWSVNSAAHMWGYRSYDNRINPCENLAVSICSMGEGWHNYHHVFPWDYKAAELGAYSVNITTMFLDAFAKIGWAYDMKEPSKDLVRRTIEKYGDGTHEVFGHHHLMEVPNPDDDDSYYDENSNVCDKKIK